MPTLNAKPIKYQIEVYESIEQLAHRLAAMRGLPKVALTDATAEAVKITNDYLDKLEGKK